VFFPDFLQIVSYICFISMYLLFSATLFIISGVVVFGRISILPCGHKIKSGG